MRYPAAKIFPAHVYACKESFPAVLIRPGKWKLVGEGVIVLWVAEESRARAVRG